MTLIVARGHERTAQSGSRQVKTRIGTGTSPAPHRRHCRACAGVVWEAWGKPDAANQRIDFVSSHVEKMLGYSQEEWLSTPNFWLHDRSSRTTGSVRRAEAAAIFASGKGGTSRFRWMHKDGREVWVEAQSIVVCDETWSSRNARRDDGHYGGCSSWRSSARNCWSARVTRAQRRKKRVG